MNMKKVSVALAIGLAMIVSAGCGKTESAEVDEQVIHSLREEIREDYGQPDEELVEEYTKQWAGEEPASGFFEEDGTYVVAESNHFIGIDLITMSPATGRLHARYAVATGVSSEQIEIHYGLYILSVSGTVVDCGMDSFVKGFDKYEYMGLNYDDAMNLFCDFIINGPVAESGETVFKIDAVIDDNEDYEKYEPLYEYLRKTYAPKAELSVVPLEPEEIEARVAMQAAIYEGERERIEEEKRQEAERLAEEARQEAERLAEEQAARERIVTSQEEITAQIAKGNYNLELGSDITIDMGNNAPLGMILECKGYAVTLTGCLSQDICSMDNSEIYLNGASAINMSSFSVNTQNFTLDNIFPEHVDGHQDRQMVGIVVALDIDYKNVTFPSSILIAGTAGGDISPLEGYTEGRINDVGDQVHVAYIGPLFTYEKLNEIETAMVKEVLTNGDLDDCSVDYSGACEIWTDVSVNIGSVVLPDQDYEEIIVRPGGHLTVSGTIKITGGRVCFTLTGYDQLNITGLGLIKAHPSSDMVKVSFPSSVGGNESALQAYNAGKGKISYDMSSESFNITIW